MENNSKREQQNWLQRLWNELLVERQFEYVTSLSPQECVDNIQDIQDSAPYDDPKEVRIREGLNDTCEFDYYKRINGISTEHSATATGTILVEDDDTGMTIVRGSAKAVKPIGCMIYAVPFILILLLPPYTGRWPLSYRASIVLVIILATAFMVWLGWADQNKIVRDIENAVDDRKLKVKRDDHNETTNNISAHLAQEKPHEQSQTQR